MLSSAKPNTSTPGTFKLSRLNGWSMCSPNRRFAVILADANARLAANADCYSFIAVDFHHLLFAGFYRRTGLLDFCTARRALLPGSEM